ncbi:protein FAR1-RELATED SEQUENCE 1-like [Cannabis sativa]|uniref:protein FAR1-RELATED SEQUENCE 1-like n=1 Tax=Cannabis sativa TaxID=3483 RepID=UPI0029CA77E4|nr:protein FAR1-RELATED SEQUENCE 1-like [Cannabis sativa]
MIYTHSKFKELQKELAGKLYCNVSCNGDDDKVFNVIETLFVGDQQRERTYIVKFNKENCEINCACRLFEFKGILCRHILSILTQEHVKKVPEKYLLARWRKDINRCHTRIKVNYNDVSGNVDTQRYNRLQKKFYEVADWAIESKDNCETFWNVMNGLPTKRKGCDKQERKSCDKEEGKRCDK